MSNNKKEGIAYKEEMEREQVRIIKNQKEALQKLAVEKGLDYDISIEEYTEFERKRLKERYGENEVWNIDELDKEFKVIEFQAPFIVVERLSDKEIGSMKFQHNPRFYFDFRLNNPKPNKNEGVKTMADVLNLKNEDDVEKFAENFCKRLGISKNLW